MASSTLLGLILAGCEVVVGATRERPPEDAAARDLRGIEAAVDSRAPDQVGLCTAELCNGKDDDCDGLIDDGAPCAAGQACVSAVCIVSPRPCSSSADCTLAGQSCVAGSCSPAQCGSSFDCGGQLCVGNLCTPKRCANDLQCGMSQSCVAGLCSPPECTKDSDCTGGLCLGGSCPRRCATNGECDAAERCQGGFCR
jgi:hypothetical protein